MQKQKHKVLTQKLHRALGHKITTNMNTLSLGHKHQLITVYISLIRQNDVAKKAQQVNRKLSFERCAKRVSWLSSAYTTFNPSKLIG